MDIAYIGYSEVLLEQLLKNDLYNVKKVVYVPHRVNERYRNILTESKVDCFEINNKNQMDALFEFLDGITIIIMYKFEFIIPQKYINTKRIFNFHGGNLRFNRGAHSMVRSILNMDNETFLSLYELSDKIDLGCLIEEYKIPLSMKETVSDIDKKLQQGIPSLLTSLNLYLEGKIHGQIISDGVYYPKIEKKDFTIDLKKDSILVMDAKLRSQVDYFGAIVIINGIEKRIHTWKLQSDANQKQETIITNDSIYVSDGKQCLIMYIDD